MLFYRRFVRMVSVYFNKRRRRVGGRILLRCEDYTPPERRASFARRRVGGVRTPSPRRLQVPSRSQIRAGGLGLRAVQTRRAGARKMRGSRTRNSEAATAPRALRGLLNAPADASPGARRDPPLGCQDAAASEGARNLPRARARRRHGAGASSARGPHSCSRVRGSRPGRRRGCGQNGQV